MELIFIYNAGSGFFDSVTDFAHKLISPSTYQCNLCALTHGNFGIKTKWKEYLDSLAISQSFYHKDEWEKQADSKKFEYPVVLLKNEKKELKPIITSDEMNGISDLDQLISIFRSKIYVYFSINFKDAELMQ